MASAPWKLTPAGNQACLFAFTADDLVARKFRNTIGAADALRTSPPFCEEVGAQRRVRARLSKRRFAFPGADDGLLSFFAATFAPVKFELSPERLAETLLR
jgi:hypothetical protein